MQGSLVYVIWTACYLAVLIGLSAYGVHRYFIIYPFLKNRKRAAVPAGQFRQLPKVTVQLPIFNEVYVVERLLRSVSEVDYPRNLLQIQVLDDSTDDTREVTASSVKELRQRGFDVQLIHRVDRTGFKAGALAVGLESAAGEFIGVENADELAGRRFRSAARFAPAHNPFFHRSENRDDPKSLGPFESRLLAAHAHAGHVFGRPSFARANGAQPKWTLF